MCETISGGVGGNKRVLARWVLGYFDQTHRREDGPWEALSRGAALMAESVGEKVVEMIGPGVESVQRRPEGPS